MKKAFIAYFFSTLSMTLSAVINEDHYDEMIQTLSVEFEQWINNLNCNDLRDFYNFKHETKGEDYFANSQEYKNLQKVKTMIKTCN